MGILLKLLPYQLPVFIRKRMLAELVEATADAFQCPVPALDHLSYDEGLQTYARFTRQQAEKALLSGQNVAAVKTRLYQKAILLGGRLRKWFGVDATEEVMQLGQTLYQALAIELEGNSLGEVTVKRCYFSQFYSVPVCDLISALDNGIFSGLSGGGRLVFTERITEGRLCCRAKLQFMEEGNR